MTKVEMYALTDPVSGDVRYIGKANDAQKRYKNHMREVRRVTPLYCWIQSLRARGLIPGLRVISVCDESEWREEERKLIASERQINSRLLNVADGGDEPFCPKNVRAENGRRNAKARVDTPFKAHIWKIKREVSQLIRHGHGDNETRELLREAARLKPSLFGCYANLKNRD